MMAAANRASNSRQRLVLASVLVVLNLVLIGLNVTKHEGVFNRDKTNLGSSSDNASATQTLAQTPSTPAPSPASPTTPATGTASTTDPLQNELNRVLATTPLIFEVGQSNLTELHKRILNSVANALKGHPGQAVRVIGYTDKAGNDTTNMALSTARAASVKTYLVDQGVSANDLITEARGSANSTGSADLANLERRVTFEVVAPAAKASQVTMKVGLVAPSARNDLAFTQSMVDALNLVAANRGGMQVDITDSTFVPADAVAAIKRYADQNYNLVIAHGVEFAGNQLIDIVKAHPNTVFAWGTATDTFGLPNLYAYDAAAEQGGYVMGAMAAQLSAAASVGEVGPIEIADAKRYINGFKNGALAEKPGLKVQTEYTGSFGDIALASETAKRQIETNGADVLTGTAEMVVGAVSVAQTKHVLWFGTQANQTQLAPDIVVASQVYHWEVLLKPIVDDIDAGKPAGRGAVATLANGGLAIEYNPGYPIPPGVKARGDQLVANIKSGALVVPNPLVGP